MIKFNAFKAKIEELEEHRIETWREVLKEYRRPFIFLKPEDSLFDAVKILTKNRVHRLPIIDPHTGNVVCIVTHKRILRYLYLFVSFQIFQTSNLNRHCYFYFTFLKDLRHATATIFAANHWRAQNRLIRNNSHNSNKSSHLRRIEHLCLNSRICLASSR